MLRFRSAEAWEATLADGIGDIELFRAIVEAGGISAEHVRLGPHSRPPVVVLTIANPLAGWTENRPDLWVWELKQAINQGVHSRLRVIVSAVDPLNRCYRRRRAAPWEAALSARPPNER
jgi:hypothetical protein